MNSLLENKTWKYEKLPEGARVIENGWVYKVKDGLTEDEEKLFKSRLVVKGYTQRYGVDYTEVFSLVAKYATIRLICALVVLFDLVLDQMDVVTAFLNGTLEEVIYMKPPQGFAKKGYEHLVCRLLKTIYGLKQSPRRWNKRFDNFMISQGYTRSSFDPCVYQKRVSNSIFGWIILVLYVDDMLILAKDQSEVDKLKAQLSSEFKMKDLGKAKKILGMEIHRDRKAGKLWLT